MDPISAQRIRATTLAGQAGRVEYKPPSSKPPTSRPQSATARSLDGPPLPKQRPASARPASATGAVSQSFDGAHAAPWRPTSHRPSSAKSDAWAPNGTGLWQPGGSLPFSSFTKSKGQFGTVQQLRAGRTAAGSEGSRAVLRIVGPHLKSSLEVLKTVEEELRLPQANTAQARARAADAVASHVLGLQVRMAGLEMDVRNADLDRKLDGSLALNAAGAALPSGHAEYLTHTPTNVPPKGAAAGGAPPATGPGGLGGLAAPSSHEFTEHASWTQRSGPWAAHHVAAAPGAGERSPL